jgi:hypothetical protein
MVRRNHGAVALYHLLTPGFPWRLFSALTVAVFCRLAGRFACLCNAGMSGFAGHGAMQMAVENPCDMERRRKMRI